MKKIFSYFSLLLVTFSFSQELVLVKFKDKPSGSYYLSNPTQMLTQKALDRRVKYSIPLSISDVPVGTSYVMAIKSLNLNIIAESKWFNGVFVEIDESQKSQIKVLSFVQEVESFVKNPSGAQNLTLSVSQSKFKNTYSSTTAQIEQIGLNQLHNLNYKGKNITIAVMDAGFPGVDIIPQFEYLRANNQIKGGYNFVDNNHLIYTRNNHGTQVLSIMGGYVSNQFTGTAIDSDFYLFITEKTEVEIPQEEVWWIAAAEKADSLGVDIINSSLGYNTFDDSRYNYTLNDLDGKISFISRAAQTAAEKGILVVTAAGNEGNKPWGKITVPADAQDVFSVGAVNSNGIPAYLSSYGPSADGRIKPDVVALGEGTSLITSLGVITSGNGTSYASPIIAGAMACLLQVHPTVSPSILRQKIRESATLFTNPTNQKGYGVPDFTSVFQMLKTDEVKPDSKKRVVYPNPVTDVLHIKISSGKPGNAEIEFFTYAGQLVYFKKAVIISGENHITVNIPYPVRIHSNLLMKFKSPDGEIFSQKIIVK